MFRVRQSQILPELLDGLFNRFSDEDAVKTVKVKHTPNPVAISARAAKPSKRRRRPRRFAGAAGSTIRTTWF